MVRVMKLLLVALCATLVVGCATTDPSTKDTPDSSARAATATATAGAQQPDPSATPTPKPKKAGIGDSITLAGSDAKISVKLLGIRDPLSAGDYDQPDSGKRYVGIMIEMANVGTTTYKDSPGNGATIIYGNDEQASNTLVVGGPCAGSFANDVRIAPGAKRRGCIPFELPKSRKAKMLQFALDSGFADEDGEWVLR
jgi:hypothetical protein